MPGRCVVGGCSNTISHVLTCIFTSTAKIYDSQYNQHPVGLMAQLLERCISIAEVVVSNPVRALHVI